MTCRIETKISEGKDAYRTEKGKPILMFTNVVSGAPRHEICRLFAATLQLVNDGNVTLIQNELQDSQLEIELQTPVEAFKQIENYLAPSIKLSVSQPTTGASLRDISPTEQNINIKVGVDRSPPAEPSRNPNKLLFIKR